MNKQFLSKTLSIVLALTFVLSNIGGILTHIAIAGPKHYYCDQTKFECKEDSSGPYDKILDCKADCIKNTSTAISINSINGNFPPFNFVCPTNPLFNPVSISGSGTGSAPPGQIQHYHVQVDWGDNTIENDLGTFTPSSGQGNFTFTFQAGPHNYSANSYQLKARLYHLQPPGNDNQADAVITIPICVVITECTPAATSTCDTHLYGICSTGTKTCSAQGTWGQCVPNNQAVTEICDNQLDDDCDGHIDAEDTDCKTTTTTVPPTGGGGGGGGTITGTVIPTGGVVAGAATGPGEVLGASTECNPYLLKYIKLGADNDPEEVKKLESFLNEQLGLDLPIDGVYDQRDYEAVKQFQLLMKDKILAPWVEIGCLPNVDTQTGYVYKTTQWAINNMFCPIPQPDLSDETCHGQIVGLGHQTTEVLGASTSNSTTTSEPTTEPNTLETTVSPTTNPNHSLNWVWYLVGLALVGGGAYLAFAKKKK